MSRGSEAAAPVAVVLVELLQTRMHHPYRCCVAMRLRAETRDRCLSCARRSPRGSILDRHYIRWTVGSRGVLTGKSGNLCIGRGAG
jgi:hypothetical protein